MISWSAFEPLLLPLALAVVLLWFLTALAFLLIRVRALKAAIRKLVKALVEAEAGREDDVDVAVTPASELRTAWRRVRAARFVAADGSTVLAKEPADLIEANSLIGASAWYRFCQATPNYLVGLGLGFTFLGLVLALGSIDATNLGDPASLTKLFAAMKFKFISSMMGIFTSIAFSLLLRLRLSSLDRQVATLQSALAHRYGALDPTVDAIHGLSARVATVASRLENVEVASIRTAEFSQTSISRLEDLKIRLDSIATATARTAQSSEGALSIWGDVVYQLTTAATQLKEFNTELSISIGNVLEQRFEQKLLPPISEALRSLELAVHGVKDARATTDSQMMFGVVKGFQDAIAGGTRGEVAAIADTLRQLNSSLAATQADLQGVGKTIERSVVVGIQGATSELSTTLSIINAKLIDGISAASGAMASNLDGATSQARASFTDAASRLSELLRQAEGSLSSTTVHLEGTERIVQRFDHTVGKLDGLRQTLMDVATPIQRATDSLSAAAVSISAVAESMKTASQQSQTAVDRVAQSWNQAGDRFEGVDREMAHVFESMNAGLASYAATVNDFNGKLTEQFTRATTSLQGIVGDMDETLKDIQIEMARLRS